MNKYQPHLRILEDTKLVKGIKICVHKYIQHVHERLMVTNTIEDIL